jgi:Transcriptional regulatory protein, C terminal
MALLARTSWEDRSGGESSRLGGAPVPVASLRALIWSRTSGAPLKGAWLDGLHRVCRVTSAAAVKVALRDTRHDVFVAYHAGAMPAGDFAEAASLVGALPVGLPVITILELEPARLVGVVAAILDAGFDDVLASGVSAVELAARVRAIGRRCRTGPPPQPRPRVALRRAEANILAYLEANADRVVSQRELIERVLGGTHTTDGSLVRVHVASLRKRLGDARGLVRTARGRGYLVDAEQLHQWRTGELSPRWF